MGQKCQMFPLEVSSKRFSLRCLQGFLVVCWGGLGGGGGWFCLFYSLQLVEHTTKGKKDKPYVFLGSRQASPSKINGLICDLQRESQ